VGCAFGTSCRGLGRHREVGLKGIVACHSPTRAVPTEQA